MNNYISTINPLPNIIKTKKNIYYSQKDGLVVFLSCKYLGIMYDKIIWSLKDNMFYFLSLGTKGDNIISTINVPYINILGIINKYIKNPIPDIIQSNNVSLINPGKITIAFRNATYNNENFSIINWDLSEKRLQFYNDDHLLKEQDFNEYDFILQQKITAKIQGLNNNMTRKINNPIPNIIQSNLVLLECNNDYKIVIFDKPTYNGKKYILIHWDLNNNQLLFISDVDQISNKYIPIMVLFFQHDFILNDDILDTDKYIENINTDTPDIQDTNLTTSTNTDDICGTQIDNPLSDIIYTDQKAVVSCKNGNKIIEIFNATYKKTRYYKIAWNITKKKLFFYNNDKPVNFINFEHEFVLDSIDKSLLKIKKNVKKIKQHVIENTKIIIIQDNICDETCNNNYINNQIKVGLFLKDYITQHENSTITLYYEKNGVGTFLNENLTSDNITKKEIKNIYTLSLFNNFNPFFETIKKYNTHRMDDDTIKRIYFNMETCLKGLHIIYNKIINKCSKEVLSGNSLNLFDEIEKNIEHVISYISSYVELKNNKSDYFFTKKIYDSIHVKLNEVKKQIVPIRILITNIYIIFNYLKNIKDNNIIIFYGEHFNADVIYKYITGSYKNCAQLET